MDESPFLRIKQLETEVGSVLSPIDVYELDRGLQKLIAAIKHELVDARLDIRDYELSETRAEQLEKAKAAQKRLEALRKNILTASEHDIFSAVDVAQLTAQLDFVAEHIN